MHPTATTYSTVVVGASPTHATAKATPTVDTYHVNRDEQYFEDFATNLHKNLEFVDGATMWSNFARIEYPDPYGLWNDNLQLEFSYTYHSPFSGETYPAIAPAYLWVENNGKVVGAWFIDVFNDYQAVHGYEEFDHRRDGEPSSLWPGFTFVQENIIRSSIPAKFGKYRRQFTDVQHAAPLVKRADGLKYNLPPRVVRILRPYQGTLHDMSHGTSTRDVGNQDESDDVVISPPSQLDSLPAFQWDYVYAGGPTDVTYPPVTIDNRVTKWLPFVTGADVGGDDIIYSTDYVQAQAPAMARIIINFENGTKYVSKGDPGELFSTGNDGVVIRTPFSKAGSETQLVGYLTRTGYLMFSPYGVTNSSPDFTVGGSTSYVIGSSNIYSEIISRLPQTGRVSFVYDASHGSYGKITWKSAL